MLQWVLGPPAVSVAEAKLVVQIYNEVREKRMNFLRTVMDHQTQQKFEPSQPCHERARDPPEMLVVSFHPQAPSSKQEDIHEKRPTPALSPSMQDG